MRYKLRYKLEPKKRAPILRRGASGDYPSQGKSVRNRSLGDIDHLLRRRLERFTGSFLQVGRFTATPSFLVPGWYVFRIARTPATRRGLLLFREAPSKTSHKNLVHLHSTPEGTEYQATKLAGDTHVTHKSTNPANATSLDHSYSRGNKRII